MYLHQLFGRHYGRFWSSLLEFNLRSPGNSSRTDKRLLIKMRKSCFLESLILIPLPTMYPLKAKGSETGAGLGKWGYGGVQLRSEVGGGWQVKGSSLWCDAATVRPQLCAPLSADWEGDNLNTAPRIDKISTLPSHSRGLDLVYSDGKKSENRCKVAWSLNCRQLARFWVANFDDWWSTLVGGGAKISSCLRLKQVRGGMSEKSQDNRFGATFWSFPSLEI